MDEAHIDQRYERNFETITPSEQSVLERSSVCIAGLGGLGGAVMEMLARTGVGRIKGIDGDRFERSNLNRQLFSSEDAIGKPKAAVAADRIRTVNSRITVTCEKVMLTHGNIRSLITGFHVVLDCLDAINTRFMLQEAAADLEIPVVSGAVAGTVGQVTVIFPGDGGYELIYGRDGREKEGGIEKRLGTLSYCAMFTAAVQASECVKVLLQKDHTLQNRLLIADLATNSFETVDLT